MTEEVGKVIHDLYEELVEVRKQNVGLRNANEIYSKQNIDLRKNQDQDDLNRQITELKKENNIFKKDNHLFRQDNADLKAKLENNVIDTDTYTTTIYQENMKRLAYLEKHVAENRYVFTEIPNTPENLKMVKLMKKYINKRKYTMRWRGQYLVDGENWKKYTYGQPLSKSKCIRVYIDSKAYSIDTVEGFNANEVDTIIDALNCWEDKLSVDFYKSDTVTQLLNYFESMRLHLENSASTPIKDNVNIVIPKGDKNCHTK